MGDKSFSSKAAPDIQIVIANHSEVFTREELASLFERFIRKINLEVE